MPLNVDCVLCPCRVTAAAVLFTYHGAWGVWSERMWVCSQKTCMFCLAIDDNPAHQQLEALPVDQDIDCEEEDTLSYDDICSYFTICSPAVARMVLALLPSRDSPKCRCGFPCKLVLCNSSGCYFWACSVCICPDIFFCSEGSCFDFGHFVPLGASTIDRYTTWGFVLRCFGHSFRSTFFDELRMRSPDAPFPSGSIQLEQGDEYDIFISYRGALGPFWIFSSLIGKKNMLPAFILLVAVFPVVVLIIFFAVSDPCLSGVPRFFLQSGTCDSGSRTCSESDQSTDNCSALRGQNVFANWFVFFPYGTSLIILMVLFWNPVMSFAQGTRRIFLDK